MAMRRFELYWCDFENRKGYNIKGIHPCLIVSSNAISDNSPIITIIPVTSAIKNDKMITHVVINDFEECGLTHESCALVEQIISIGKDKILDKIGYIYNKNTREKINKSISVALGIIQ